MLLIQQINGFSYDNMRILNSHTMWEESKDDFPMNKSISASQVCDKVFDKAIKLTCSSDQYFDIAPIRRRLIQFTSTISGGIATKELFLYKNKPDEIYLSLTDGLVDMKNSSTLRKEFLIKVVNLNNSRVEYYGLIITLSFKISPDKETDFDIDIGVYKHELRTVSLLPSTIDFSFFALVIYCFIMWGIKKDSSIFFDYASIAITLAYISQLIFRSIHIGDTWVIIAFNYIFRHKKHKINNKFSIKRFERWIIKSHDLYVKKPDYFDF